MNLREYYRTNQEAIDDRRQRMKDAERYVMECAEKLADGKATLVQLKQAVMDWHAERRQW